MVTFLPSHTASGTVTCLVGLNKNLLNKLMIHSISQPFRKGWFISYLLYFECGASWFISRQVFSETIDHVDHNIGPMAAAEAWGLGFVVGNAPHFIHSLWIISSSLMVFTSMQINSIFASLSLNVFLNWSCISVPMYLWYVKDWTQFLPHLMHQDKLYALLFGHKRHWCEADPHFYIPKENKVALQILGKLERNGVKWGERKEGDNNNNKSISFASCITFNQCSPNLWLLLLGNI